MTSDEQLSTATEEDRAEIADLKQRGFRVQLVNMETPHRPYACILQPPYQRDSIARYGTTWTEALESAKSQAKDASPDLFD